MMNSEELEDLWKRTYKSVDLNASDPELALRTFSDLDEDGLEGSNTILPTKLSNSNEAASTFSDPPGQDSFSGSETLATATKPLPEEDALDASKSSYNLLSELGRGGMGVVYRAKQTALKREIAVKKVLSQGKSKAVKDNFLNESLVTGILEHPNIVPVHDLGMDELGETMLAMKLVSGSEWRDLLHPKSEDDKKKADDLDLVGHLNILLAVCNAVSFAHSRGIVHLDLKPENVMVGEFGEILVMDWGIAVCFNDSSEQSEFLARASSIEQPRGTPSYMPPELAEGDGASIDQRTDVFLLGAILHEILTGRPPYRGRTILAVIAAASLCEPPQLSEEIHEGLRRICLKALSKEPEQRYSTVKELQSELKSYLSHRESLQVSGRSNDLLKLCEGALKADKETESQKGERDQLYADFAEVVAGYKQAFFLWSENPEAKSGEERARLSYAKAALSFGDVGLAEAQLSKAPESEKRSEILQELVTLKEDRARHERASKRLKTTIVSAVALILVVTLTGAYLVNERRKEAETEKLRAEAQKLRADGERDKARKENIATQLKSASVAIQLANLQLMSVANSYSYYKGTNPQGVYGEATELAKVIEGIDLKRFDGNQLVDDDMLKEAYRAKNDVEKATLSIAGALLTHQRLVRTYGSGVEDINCMTLSPNGEFVLAGMNLGVLLLWEVESGKPIQCIRGHTKKVTACAFSPDGTKFISGASDAMLKLWDCKTGKEIKRFEARSEVSACSFSSDGTKIVSGTADGALWLWHEGTGKLIQAFSGHSTRILHCALSENGEQLLSTAGLSKLWDCKTGHCLQTFGDQEKETLACSFSRGGNFVYTISRNALNCWDPKSGKPIRKNPAIRGKTAIFQSTHEGDWILFSRGDGTLRITDYGSGKLIHEIKLTNGTLYEYEIDRAGKVLASRSSEGLSLWRLEKGKFRRCFVSRPMETTSVALTPDGKRILTGDIAGNVQLRSKESGALVKELKAHNQRVCSLAFSPDGTKFVSAASNGSFKLWDLKSSRLLQDFGKFRGPVRFCAFSFDGCQILTAMTRVHFALWDVRTGKNLWKKSIRKRIVSCFFSPNEPEVIIGCLNSIEIRTQATGELKRTFRTNNSKSVWLDTSWNCILLECSGSLYYLDSLTGEVRREPIIHRGQRFGGLSPMSRHRLQYSQLGDIGLWNESGKKIHVYGRRKRGALRSTWTHWGRKRNEGPKVKKLRSAFFSPQGDYVLARYGDRSLKLWDSKTGVTWKNQLFKRSSINAYALSKDKLAMLTGAANGQLILRDSRTGLELRAFKGHRSSVNTCKFSPDGKVIVSGSSAGALILWDYKSGKKLHSFKGHSAAIHDCVFSRDGQQILSASSDKTLKLWDRKTGKEIRTFKGHSREVKACAFSPDGKTVLSGDRDGTLKLWSYKSGKLIRSIKGPRDILACLFLPGGKQLLVGGYFRSAILNSQTGDIVNEIDCPIHTSGVKDAKKVAIEHSSNGRKIVITHDRGAWLYDRDSKTTKTLISNQSWNGAFCTFVEGDSRVITATSRGCWSVWNSKTGKLIRDIGFHRGGIGKIDISPDYETILTGAGDTTLKLWNRRTGRLIRTLYGHSQAVNTCKFSPDGKVIVSGSSAGALILWDYKSGKKLHSFKGHSAAIHDCVFSRDGQQILSASSDKTLKLWDRKTGKEIRTFKGHSREVKACAFSPDGKTVLSGDRDGTLKLWSCKSGKLIRSIRGHRETIQSCVFSPDGQQILSASSDKTLKLWDRQLKKLARVFLGHTKTVLSAIFSSDGHEILSVGVDSAKFWNRKTGLLLHDFDEAGTGDKFCVFLPGDKEALVGRHLISIHRYSKKELFTDPSQGLAESMRQAWMNMTHFGQPSTPPPSEFPKLNPIKSK